MSTTKQVMKFGTAALLALLLGAPATGLADKAPPPKKEAAGKDAGRDANKKDVKKDAKKEAQKDTPPPAPAGW